MSGFTLDTQRKDKKTTETKMKVLVLLLAATLCLVAGDDMRSCITNDDCESDECCISLVFVRGFCHSLGKEGDHCINKPAETEHGERNLFGCPCTEGLKCVSEIIQEEGKTIYKNPTCKAPTV